MNVKALQCRLDNLILWVYSLFESHNTSLFSRPSLLETIKYQIKVTIAWVRGHLVSYTREPGNDATKTCLFVETVVLRHLILTGMGHNQSCL